MEEGRKNVTCKRLSCPMRRDHRSLQPSEYHEAVTLADQRVFELGCAGVVTGIYWLAITLEICPFSTAAPNLHQDARNLYDDLIVQLRDCTARPFVTKHDWAAGLVSFFRNYAVSCGVIILMETKFRLLELITLLIHEYRTGDTSRWPEYKFGPEMFVFVFGVLEAVALVFAAMSNEQRSKERRMKDMRVSWSLFCLYTDSLAMTTPTLLVTGGIFVYVMLPKEWMNIIQQVSTLKDWPTNTTCPLLWSDPMASWIWALA